MTTKLDKVLVREVDINGETYTVKVGPGGITVTKKQHRNGVEWPWRELINLNLHALRSQAPVLGVKR